NLKTFIEKRNSKYELQTFLDPENYDTCGYHPLGKNPGDFWQITTKPFPEAHFAVYPEELCIKPIKSSCPRWICSKCGFIRERITELQRDYQQINEQEWQNYAKRKGLNPFDRKARIRAFMDLAKRGNNYKRTTKGWTKCSCNAPFVPGVVLDPFCGSGTTCVVARKLGRNYIGIDLNPDYCKMARKRLSLIPARLEVFTAAKKFSENQT
ncbi:MAG: DNA methyltransferase, partial [Candidatus Heimdallarchaeaceae archaeon]